MDTLKSSIYSSFLPYSLVDHIDHPQFVEQPMKYILPDICNSSADLKIKKIIQTKPSDVRIPARLNNALIPYPAEMKELCNGTFTGDKNIFHSHHFSQIKTLIETKKILTTKFPIPVAPIRYDMDSLKSFAKLTYSTKEKLIGLATLAFAKRATNADLSICAGGKVESLISTGYISSYLPFLIMIQRLRVHISKESNYADLNTFVSQRPKDGATYKMFTNGAYIYGDRFRDTEFYLISCGGHFQIYHNKLNYWFAGPMPYLDYLFTIADVLNNIDIIRNHEEYSWANKVLGIMIEFSEHEGHHKEQVDFMKSMEGFLLNISDYDTNHSMNWKPIINVIEELWNLDKSISGIDYDVGLIFSLIEKHPIIFNKSSFLCRFIVEIMKLTRTQSQEISALHKLIFYAEVNPEAGVMKFLERVHTKRDVNPDAIRNLTRFAKSSFYISYSKKHNSPPNIIGPVHKIRILELHIQTRAYNLIETLPLTWWDDLRIFDCMDNTLTDDPLEFAKDKGALRDKISFGPGDSRKELLQVIEKTVYNLGDFFKEKNIIPKPPKVYRTTQLSDPISVSDPARLIEKEKEQKYQARLFGNGELSNKHSLSLVAARMKKALSYFDEQLMTPTDKKRKHLIHEASRELTQRDNYSLLLDIEGHNQSMQHSNTSELCEFVGNLFGEDGWGDLSHYFSQLTVYHYDEYLDKAIVSEGQYGGIEGWLNPFWTLHTTIMMKLMRIMTDLTVRTIMVYSDDVNAIISIPQSSEAMVQAIFIKIVEHCRKFGMKIKYSQTNLSKHRITMLRQHYADGIRADSTLKRLLSISAANNPMLISDEVEIAGISSSSSSALEMSNHNETCAYLKNYKMGLLLCRLPQMILSHPQENSMISPEELPKHVSQTIYHTKDEQRIFKEMTKNEFYEAATNDLTAYMRATGKSHNKEMWNEVLNDLYGTSIAESKFIDSPDRTLYLQMYDEFIQDLLFFWIYLPTSLGGLGGSLHLNLLISGHSIGFSKSIHYLYQWVCNYSSNTEYFIKYLNTVLLIDNDKAINMEEVRLITTNWPNDRTICPATTSIRQAIKSMVHTNTKNTSILKLFKLAEDGPKIAKNMLEIFRHNFHTRIVQFYYENTSLHFIDLLINKIETSSGLLTKVRKLDNLRRNLSKRTITNIRLSAITSRTMYCRITTSCDIINELLIRKQAMFPLVDFIKVEEVLYDDKISESFKGPALLTLRRCSPSHFRNGIRVYDDPKVGSEVLYKGELMDDDRMLGNKEELLCAKLVAVTKWLLMKKNLMFIETNIMKKLDCLIACNLSLSTLTDQTFDELFSYAPTEIGGEILHRIPNIRFSTGTYLRGEMNRSLHYTVDMNQRIITDSNLVDSNINFDYLRMRLIASAVVRDKHPKLRRLVVRYQLKNLIGIHDVQFITPSPTNHEVIDTFGSYSMIFGHNLSVLRFRYLANAYLHEENSNDWALIPKIRDIESSEYLGNAYINDLIVRYARELDKEYMMFSRSHIDRLLWKPLIDKLYKIDKGWKEGRDHEDLVEIRDRLEFTLNQRSVITTVNKNSKVLIAIQTLCLEEMKSRAPLDLNIISLTQRFTNIKENMRPGLRLSRRLAIYSDMLMRFEEYRKELARYVIMEYILTFHFKVKKVGSDVLFDVSKSVEEMQENEMGSLSLLILNPELQTRTMLIGIEFCTYIANQEIETIKDELIEISKDSSLADVLIPGNLPSYDSLALHNPRIDDLSSFETIDYIDIPLCLTTMMTLESFGPLLQYAQRCSLIGASPSAFYSPTGSDSFLSQYGLFKFLLSNGFIDIDSRICDLTAGRGDGRYAMDLLSLNSDSYARPDLFTKLYHHPEIEFRNDYNVFDGTTLKFLSQYDFVHIDISFTGSTESNISDTVMFLESQKIAYSIRLNSITCKGYKSIDTDSLGFYKHTICYPINNHMKPYHTYLVGIPAVGVEFDTFIEAKNSLAFKSIAVAYSKLLHPKYYELRLTERQRNSASIYLPRDDEIIEYIGALLDRSLEQEQLYYLDRFYSEVDEHHVIQFIPDLMNREGKSIIQDYKGVIISARQNYNLSAVTDDIGNVSDKSYPYHERHLAGMVTNDPRLQEISIYNCDDRILTHFRRSHPLGYVRSISNVILGIRKFCLTDFLSGEEALADLHRQLKLGGVTKKSMHQQEIDMALKLLILSAANNDYVYGIKYCHKLYVKGTRKKKSLDRTIRTYRLLGFLFDEIQLMFRLGKINTSQLDSLRNELETREVIKYKYIGNNFPKEEYVKDGLDQNLLLTLSMDELFVGLEKFILASQDIIVDNNESPYPELNFEFNVDDQVTKTIESLGLKVDPIKGYIDLGDDDIDDSGW